jgi:hypothetical protein
MAGEIATGSIVSGSIKNHHLGDNIDIERAKLAQRVLGVHSVPLEQLRTWDARATNLPGTAATDDLGYVTGTLGTDMPSVQTGDLKAAGATTRYAGFTVALPEDYEAGQTVVLRIVAGMKTTVADTSATVDAQVYRNAGDGTVGSDLCATAAITINSLTAADKDFTITATTLEPGDILDVRVAVAVNDAATGTAVIGRIVAIELLTDQR